MTMQRVVSARRDHGEIRDDPLRDPPVVISVIRIAACTDIQPSGTLDNFKHRPQIAEVVLITSSVSEQRIRVQIAAMQERNVAGIDAALQRLKPIAFLQPFGRNRVRAGNGGEFPFGRRRLQFGRSHVGP